MFGFYNNYSLTLFCIYNEKPMFDEKIQNDATVNEELQQIFYLALCYAEVLQ